MQFSQRLNVISKSFLLACLLIVALMGFTATSASAATMPVPAMQQRSAPSSSPLNAGGCPSGDYCLWQGTNFTGLEYVSSADNCEFMSIGFVGVGSYANYSSFTVDVYFSRDHEYYFAFNILPGHTSINTGANPRAKYAQIVYVC